MKINALQFIVCIKYIEDRRDTTFEHDKCTNGENSWEAFDLKNQSYLSGMKPQ